MKTLKVNALKLKNQKALSREQMKSINGSSGNWCTYECCPEIPKPLCPGYRCPAVICPQ